MGYVDAPYTAADVERAIAEVVGDAAFAADLMRRFVQGHEVMDYKRLRHAGRPGTPQPVPRARVAGPAADRPVRRRSSACRARPHIGSAAYRAGIDVDDVIKAVGADNVGTVEQLDAALKKFKPGDRVTVTFLQRGQPVKAEVVLDQDPRFDIAAVESTGGT